MKCALFIPLLLVLAGSIACEAESRKRSYEYMPDMVYSVPYDSFAPNPVTRNGITLQRPVKGTIPRGSLPLHYGATRDEAERAGRELSNPIPATADTVAQGRVLYDTFCLVCHGERGEGDGPLVPRIPNPPSYTSARVRGMPPGRIFHVITFGSGRMPSHASQIPPDDRWLIATYVRTLQTARDHQR